MPIDEKGIADNLGFPQASRRSRTSLSRVLLFFALAVSLVLSVLQVLVWAAPPTEAKWLGWIFRGERGQLPSSSGYDGAVQKPTVPDENYTNTTRAAFDDVCGAVVTVPGTYDSHWWSGNLPALAPPPGLQYPFEYNRTLNEFKMSDQFMQSLYSAKNRIRTDLLYKSLADMNLGFIGDAAVVNDASRPADAPYVSRAAMPRWYPTELGYRVTAVWRAILTIAMEQSPDDPVSRYLATQVPRGGAIQTAQYPDTVRNLITANSARIHTGASGKTWIGMNRVFAPGLANTPPLANIQVGYDARMTSWQRGNAGPFSVEAAFIIATQTAGVNFKAVAKAIQQSDKIDTWWSGVLMPGRNVRALRCLNEQATASGQRLYGKYQLSGANGQHDQRAGMYVAFDLDPMANPDANDHNVFIFVIHAIDGYSTYQIANDNYLRNVVLTPYTPSQGKEDAKFWGPRGSTNDAPPLPPRNPTANTRQVAHAHAGILKRSDFIAWLKSENNAMAFPAYTQISMLHLYILTEDWDGADTNNWPRKHWFNP